MQTACSLEKLAMCAHSGKLFENSGNRLQIVDMLGKADRLKVKRDLYFACGCSCQFCKYFSFHF